MATNRRVAGPLAAWILLASVTPAFGAGIGTEAAAPPAEFRPILASDAEGLFEKVASLEGRWRGKSTKGWTDDVRIDVIAGRSAIVFDSFGAHQDERMLTLFTLDRGALIATHYCVARNQPRLRAEQISLDGKTVLFRFAGGGNMPSRDVGHMDSMRMTFESDGGYTQQWTWYQAGSEQWMEEIVHSPILTRNAGGARR